MGRWRDDCPDCFDEECQFCDKYIPGYKSLTIAKTPWRRIVDFFQSLTFFLKRHNIIP